ncbi:fatty acid transporter-like protein, partial [Leptotrombidium deliense]
EMDKFSNKVANCFHSIGYKAGDEVALFMESKPRQIGTWLGLAKIGVIPAFINTNLKYKSLEHSVTVINARAFIFDSEYFSVVKEAIPLINQKMKLEYFSFGSVDEKLLAECPVEVKPLKNIMDQASTANVNYKGNFSDHLFYIYTSGTTGLPKAAIIRNSRYFVVSKGTNMVLKLKNDDVLYTPLPLYHSAAAMLGVSQSLVFGASVALRPKFSASKFWEDCIRYKCTAAQYIGELCRYLLSQKETPIERQHKVRIMLGNGLKPSLWPTFQRRFAIKQIVEFYGATESNATLVNLLGKEGACGFFPRAVPRWILKLVYPIDLLKANEITGEVIRNEKGFCDSVPQSGGSGLFVGKINDNPMQRFDGYVNQTESAKKVIKDVFKKGDSFFSSGDVLSVDEYGYIYFKDRIGDTFRWKGENIATTEVESIISEASNLSDTIVFGVEVPGCEGKAGMAAIYHPTAKIDCKQILAAMKANLPPQAIPLFIRILTNLEITGTLKLPKNVVQSEGFDVTKIKDDIYFLNPKTNNYEKLDQKTYQLILEEKIKF